MEPLGTQPLAQSKMSTLDKHGYNFTRFLYSSTQMSLCRKKLPFKIEGGITSSGNDPKHIQGKTRVRRRHRVRQKRLVPICRYLSLLQSFRKSHNGSCTNPRFIFSPWLVIHLLSLNVLLLDTWCLLSPKSGEIIFNFQTAIWLVMTSRRAVNDEKAGLWYRDVLNFHPPGVSLFNIFRISNKSKLSSVLINNRHHNFVVFFFRFERCKHSPRNIA